MPAAKISKRSTSEGSSLRHFDSGEMSVGEIVQDRGLNQLGLGNGFE